VPTYFFCLILLVLQTPFLFSKVPAVEDSCNFETLTKACSVFNPDGSDLIEFKDGTAIPNIIAMENHEADSSFKAVLSRKIASQEKNRPEFLRVKQKLITLLDELRDDLVHPTFKLYLTENFVDFFEGSFIVGNRYKNNLDLPWPIEKPVGTKLVSPKEIVAKFGSRITREQFAQLEAIFTEMKLLQTYSQKTFSLTSYEEAVQKITPEREKYVAKLFDFAKLRIVSLISNGKTDRNLDSAENNLIRKVKSVKLKPFWRGAQKPHSSCLDFGPNGFYDSKDNSVGLCPLSYWLPDSGLLELISHELGHSIAPCFSQFGTYEINSSRLVKFTKGLIGGMSPEILKDPNKRALAAELLAINEKSNTTAFPLALIASSSSIKYFIDKEILKPEIPGVDFANYPLKKVASCLSDKQGFRWASEAEAKKIAFEVTEARAQYREPSYDKKADSRQILDAFSKYPTCVSADKHSQIDEAMGDWFSSQVLGDYLEGNPIVTDEQKLGVVGALAIESCLRRFRAKNQVNDSITNIMANADSDQRILEDSHPSSKNRIDRIFLTQPKIRKAFGCPARRELACER
jgi:hypothetical protein